MKKDLNEEQPQETMKVLLASLPGILGGIAAVIIAAAVFLVAVVLIWSRPNILFPPTPVPPGLVVVSTHTPAPTAEHITPTDTPTPPTSGDTTPTYTPTPFVSGSITPTDTPTPFTTPGAPSTEPSGPQTGPIRILWLDRCDPRTDPNFCHISKDGKEFEQFYGVILEMNATLTYKLPSSVADLSSYDVVVADFCGPAANDAVIQILKDYVQAGGSVVVMGDEFCQGAGPVNGNWASSGQAASLLTKSWGITFTTDDDTLVQYARPSDPHPILKGVQELFAFRHAYLDIHSPAKVLVAMGGRPFIGLYDQTGTVVAIPDVGFHWGASFKPETVESDNFVFWRNLLVWLAGQSRNKRKG